MAESEKEAASTTKPQKKSSMLDVEIGKDFFSSWKSMSVSGDDALDFSTDTAPKGKNKAFDFDKLDMDFSLDGDFSKTMSSFNVDVSDLNFSSPLKKREKSKEGTGKESTSGNREGKQDRFTFSFNFNELDSFDLDSSLLKGEEKSDKIEKKREPDPQVKNAKSQGSDIHLATGIDAHENTNIKKSPIMERVLTAKVGSMIGGLGNFDSKNGTSPSTSANSENLSASHGTTKFQEEEVSTSTKRADQFSQQQQTQGTIPNTATYSASRDDSIREAVPELQDDVCSSGTEVRNDQGTQNTDNEFGTNLENQNDFSMRDVTGNESVQGNTFVGHTPIASVSPKIFHGLKPTEGNTNSNSVHLMEFSESEPKIPKFMPMKEKETGRIHSKFFNRSDVTQSQLNMSSTSTQVHSVRDKSTDQEDKARGTQAENHQVDALKSNDQAVTRSVPVISQKADKTHNISSLEYHSARLPEWTATSTTHKGINTKHVLSSIPPIKSSKSTSVEKNKFSPLTADKNTIDVSGLKPLRPSITSKKGLSHPTVRKEIKLLTRSKENTDINTMAKMVTALGAEKHKLLSPQLKRKTFEAPSAEPMAFNPSKVTKSPGEQGKTSDQVDTKRVRNTENPEDSFLSRSPFVTPLDVPVAELEVPVLIENDGNVEKAEACAKELEDICNMLKKKHEEAKEILVRAVVNNNNLLMLNHPIHEDKISFCMYFISQTIMFS
ncbi:hypothetical protein GIB67_000218 [Kingdonia uniflora]|uniref:Uncharacterized protein n=1 Tax=Kingdonia uniflora TaxID=39325 RepID=A0A7J7PAF8_9MAGN|nr:hypothetical protein GIB67_000218 [Kingdonia uniflora]